MDMIRDSLMELFRIVNHLENVYAEHGRKFTIDGHLIGSIGEVLAAEAYNLKLAENSTPVYDAETRDASQKKVQIKATQIDRVSFSSKREHDEAPDYVIVIKINHDGTWETIYNGPGKRVYDNLGKAQKNGQSQISLSKLSKLMEIVSADNMLPPKKIKDVSYQQLIADVREDYQNRKHVCEKGIPALYWCKDCQEINLWTYWQGSLDARIMLVGQDWGSPWDDGSAEIMKLISRINDEKSDFYSGLAEMQLSPTDSNLKELFHVLGYDITKKEPDLFFTNFILGYREHGTSGGFRQQWIRDDAPYFKRLTEIIDPEMIICLGKNTFEGVMFALTGKMERIQGFNRFLDSGENYRTAALPSGKSVRVYAVAHCGTIGTMNRNRGKKNEDGSPRSSKDIAIQIQDWKRIKAKGTYKD